MRRFADVALVDPQGRVLLQERDSNPAIDPDKWGFPGGHVEEGESDEQAAYRELEEETGVRLEPGALQLVGRYRLERRPGAEPDGFALYTAATSLTEVECHEGRQMLFVDPDRAVTLDLTASAALTLADFLASPIYARVMP